MRFGVNYIPSHKWLYSWVDFDEGKIREDLEAIKALGFDHIRGHLLWSFFQLDRKIMSSHCMHNLEKFVKICEDVGMDFFLSLLTGWMSGQNFFPAWLTHGNKFRLVTGQEEYEAECYYAAQVAQVVKDSPRFLGFDVGNEINCITWRDKDADIPACDRWQTAYLEYLESLVPGKLHGNGVDHCPWFGERAFSREVLATTGAITPLHCWVEFTQARFRNGLLGSESINLTRYMAELVRAYSTDVNRMVWIQEFGCSPMWLEDGDTIEEFVRQTFDALAKIPNLWGATWWCSHDLNREYDSYHPLEYELGILDIHNNPKPYAKVIQEFIAAHKANPVNPPLKTAAMVYTPGVETAEDNWQNGKRYVEYLAQGYDPCIILPDKVTDEAYLKSRGITKILP